MDIGTLEDWLDRYAAAWEDGDPEAAGRLFTPDGSYHLTPFTSHEGQATIEEYWRRATADQDEVSVETEAITVTDDGRGIGRFRAEITDADGGRSVTDGLCIIRLDGEKCTAFREWWHKE